jgi:hypothetical protein
MAQAQVCEDKTTEQFPLGRSEAWVKNCRQIRRKAPHLCNYKAIVRDNCQYSCGLCGSLDNEAFCKDVEGSFTIAEGTQWEKARACSHAASRPEKFCSKWVFRKKCPIACGLCVPNSKVKCNGLESNCNMKVDELLYATVHNANHDRSPFQNHNAPLEDALAAGYRGLMLDVCKCEGELRFCHLNCNIGKRFIINVMTNIVDFLNNNPKDIIILNFEMSSGNPTPAELWSVMESVPGLEDKVYQKENSQWPTLADMTDVGRQIIAFSHNNPDCPGSDGCTPKIYDFFDYTKGTEYDFDTVSEIENWKSSCQIKRGSVGEKSLYSVNNFVTTNWGPSASDSQTLNQKDFLRNRVQKCTEVANAEPNFINVDYWQLGDVPEYVKEENEARANRRRKLQSS